MVRVPAESGTSPSTALIKVDLPTPLGPSTATNCPEQMARSTPLHSVRSPMRTLAARNSTRTGLDSQATSSPGGGAGAGLESAGAPGWLPATGPWVDTFGAAASPTPRESRRPTDPDAWSGAGVDGRDGVT